MKEKLKYLLFLAIITQSVNTVRCLNNNRSNEVSSSFANSGIQISYTEESFMNIFYGLSQILQNLIRKESFNTNGDYLSIQIFKIDLNKFELNKNLSKTTFLSHGKIRVQLNFNTIKITFSYTIQLSNIFSISNEGYVECDNFQVKFDAQIMSDSTKHIQFKVKDIDIHPGESSAQLNNKYISQIINYILGLSDFVLQKFGVVISKGVDIAINKAIGQIASHITIPQTHILIDLSLTAQPFLQYGYMNIPISGNSYHSDNQYNSDISSPPSLHPLRQFNPQMFGSNSTQIFVDLSTIHRIVESIISAKQRYNITLPQVASSTAPIDSRSLSPVLPGVRKLKIIHYPVFEIVLNKDSIKLEIKENQLKCNVVVGWNIYLQEGNKPESIFKYNNDVIYLSADITLNILNDKQYLTINVLSVQLLDVVTSLRDVSLVDINNIVQLFPLFNLILNDAINLFAYQYYFDINSFIGFQINQAHITFADNYLHFNLIF